MGSTFFEDTVRLKLDGHEVPICIEYSAASGIMEVPAKFTMRVGHGGIYRELAAAFPPECPYELFVGDRLVVTGELDSNKPAQESTEANLGGRDLLRRLVDDELDSDRTFHEQTYADLAVTMLEEVGLGDRTVFALNAANRKAITGTQTVTDVTAPSTEGTKTEAGKTDTRTIYKEITAAAGTTRWDFLTQQNRRAGLFFWQTADGNFVLSRPNGDQQAIYSINRLRSGESGDVSILGKPDFNNDTTGRFTECIVHGRKGAGKNGRSQFLGRYIDQEMVALLNPDPADRADGGTRKKRKILKDTKVKSILQGNHLARRRIAESRRAGWALSYTVAGHTAPALRGGGRVVWQPDTVVNVDDEELGVQGPMWVESVEFKGAASAPTLTILRLMRIEDLIFSDEADEQPARVLAKKPGVVVNEDQVRVRVVSGSNFWNVDPNTKKK